MINVSEDLVTLQIGGVKILNIRLISSPKNKKHIGWKACLRTGKVGWALGKMKCSLLQKEEGTIHKITEKLDKHMHEKLTGILSK